MNEFLRIAMKNPALALWVMVFGGTWLITSICVFLIGSLLPTTKDKSSPPALPQHGDHAPPTGSRRARRRSSKSHKRWSSPAELSQYPGSVASSSSSTLFSDPSSRKFTPELPQIESGDGTSDSSSLHSTLVDETSVSDPKKSLKQLRRVSLADRIVGIKVFKSMRKDSASTPGSSCSSTPLSLSPMSSPSQQLRELEPDVEGLNHKSESSKPIFTTPFTFRPKRSSATATMSAAYTGMEKPLLRTSTDSSLTPPTSPDETPENSLPSDPVTPVQVRTRRRFSSILSLNLNNTLSIPLSAKSANVAPSSSTPSRRKFTSPFNVLTPTLRKTPKTPAGRTQPYGYPHYARMPNGEVAVPPSPLKKAAKALRRSSLDDSILECKEPESPRTAKAINALGLSLQQGGHRRMASDSAVAQ